MRRRREAFGHRGGSTETLWPFFLSLTPLFWDVNARVKNVVAWRLASVEVSVKTLSKQLNETSPRKKGVLKEFDPVYYPGRRRKNCAAMII